MVIDSGIARGLYWGNLMKRLQLAAVLWICAIPAVCSAVTVDEAVEATRREDFAAAYPMWVALSDGGDHRATVEVGLMHHLGKGRSINFDEAYGWYLKAFPRNGDAWNNIGVMFRDGQGVPVNRKIAYLMFLTIHMEKMGSQSTIMRANRNLRRELVELPHTERSNALCYTLDYVLAYVQSRGGISGVPEAYRASPIRPRIRELNWWLKGEIQPFECPQDS